MITLTKKQRKLLDYISDFIEDKGYAPTYREIAKKFSFSSVSTVYDHVHTLQTKGYLESEEGTSSISLTTKAKPEPQQSAVEIPMVGLITAGKPIEALQENEKLQIPEVMVGKGRYFALQVKGDSMIDDGIFDGDFVVVEEKDQATDGDIVVALLENQFATLKRFYKEKNYVRLQPANKGMEPFRVKNVKVQGKVVGLIRRY